jgi:predicted DNA-binding transcriptional regulator YafY
MSWPWPSNGAFVNGCQRLEALILALRAGDVVRAADLARASGLSERLCRRSLEALANVGLMSREVDGRFVRRRLRPS